MITTAAADGRGMAQTPIGNAADEASPVAETVRRREILVPQQLSRHPGDDALLEAIRAGLAPADPVAGLLTRWPAPPPRPVGGHVVRRAPAAHSS
jgi:hypothetical protein